MQKKILCLLLATLLALGALCAVAAIHPDDLPEGAGLVVTAGTLRVRQGPTTDSAIIGRVYEGDLLTVLGSAGNWFRVLTPLGTEGYVYKNYVDVALKEDEPPVTDDGTYDDILLPDGEVEFEATLVRADGWNDYTPFAVQDFVYAGHMEKDGFVGSRTAEQFPEAFAQIAKYDETYFDTAYKTLLVFNLVAPSGSVRFAVEEVCRENDTLIIRYSKDVPETGTDDMAEWLCFVEIPNHEYNGERIVLEPVDSPVQDAQEEGETPVTSFGLSLVSNPSTGYAWTAEISDPAVLALTAEGYEADEAEPLPGSGGAQYFEFAAHAPGSALITFTYARPWESAQPQAVRLAAVTVTDGLHMTHTLYPEAESAALVSALAYLDSEACANFTQLNGIDRDTVACEPLEPDALEAVFATGEALDPNGSYLLCTIGQTGGHDFAQIVCNAATGEAVGYLPIA